MGLLGKVASKVENHVPVSIRIVAKEFSQPGVKIGAFRGRAVSFGASVVSATEAIAFLALTIITKIINAITLRKSSGLNQLGDSFLNQAKDRSLSSLHLLYGAIINPERGLSGTLDLFDEDYENPDVSLMQHLENETFMIEEEERLAKEAEQLERDQNPLYSIRL